MTVQDQITTILETEFRPLILKVVNISKMHISHSGDDGSGESHFEITIKSPVFAKRSRVDCHRMIYGALEAGLEKMPHALAIKASS